MNNLRAQIEHHMRELNLKGMLGVYVQISQDATKSNLTYDEYLAILLEEEARRKKEGSIKKKVGDAKFPFLKTIDEFDFSFQPEIKEKEVIQLSGLEFIEQKGNALFLGPPGVGKTHLAIGLGIKACMAKYRVVFVSTQKLIDGLMLSQRDGSLMERLLWYSRLHLLIIDELGYMPINREAANLLFQLISLRYEKGSIILTSNYNFDEWGAVFEDRIVATAIIDRLVHHAKIFYVNGHSYRLKDKLKKGLPVHCLSAVTLEQAGT